MSGRRTRRRAVIQRMVVGSLLALAAVLLAPSVAAQPEVEANDAINATWQASGGENGPLGPRQGDVYRVGDGFAQDFARGKIFFTPQTGAHFVQGAILEKYESLGGPADGDLGFPTIDESPGRAPGSLNVTFSAPDNPVIFFTPETGARVVRGAINAAWDRLGGSTGVLGVPAEDEVYHGDLVSQKFTGGELTYNLEEKTFTTVPPEVAGQLEGLAVPDDPVSAINAARRAAGGPLGPLGKAEGPPEPIGANGLVQKFAGGKIFYTPETGARVLTGQLLQKYESVGGPAGDLGFPISGETDGGFATESRMARFAAEDGPVIFWTPDHGAVIVRGAMAAAWDRLGGAAGPLGAPTADQSENGDVITQTFTGGNVSWNRTTNTFTTEPAELADQLSGLEVPGYAGSESTAGPAAADTDDEGRFAGSWWWLLALIPLLVLIALVLFAVLRRRRGGGEDPFADDYDADDEEFGGEPEASYDGEGTPQPVPADEAARLFGDRYAQEGLGALAPHSEPSLPEVDPWSAPIQGSRAGAFGPAASAGAVGAAATGQGFTAPAPEAGPDFGVEHDVVGAPPGTAAEPETAAEAPMSAVPDRGAFDTGTFEDDENPDDVDTAPTRVIPEPQAPPRRDPLRDTGRHARIEDDEDEPQMLRTAFVLADPNAGDEPPEGYPVKASASAGRFWAPGDPGYAEVQPEIWFATAELAQANGFQPGGEAGSEDE